MIMSCENRSGGQQLATHSPKRRSLEPDSLLQAITLPKHNNLLDSQKQNIREPKPKLAEKTQRIRKDKKNERKNNNREDSTRGEIEEFQVSMVEEAVDRLKEYLSMSERRGRKSRETEEERLLEFLEKIEGEYSKTVTGYMKQNINKEACGNLRGMLTRFVKQVITAFPLLQQRRHYSAQQYIDPGLKHRFETLMVRNTTPLISLHIIAPNHPFPEPRSPSPEREEEPELSEDERKLEKKKRRSKKRKERRESQVEDEKDEEGVQQLNRFLEDLSIREEQRVECRVAEQRLARWGRGLCASDLFKRL